MPITPELAELINSLNQELNQTEQQATRGLNRTRDLLSQFSNNAILTQYFAYFNTVLSLVENSKRQFFREVDARGTSQECPECGAEVKKDLSVRVHHCPSCGYTTDRNAASGQVIRNRGIALISTAGHVGMEPACADGLSGVGATQSRQHLAARTNLARFVR